MNFVNKQDISLFKLGEHCTEVKSLFNGRTTGDLHLCAHLIGYDVSKSCFSKSGRAVKQNVIKCITSALCSVHIHVKIVLDLFLTYIVLEHLRAKLVFLIVIITIYGSDDSILFLRQDVFVESADNSVVFHSLN